MKRIGTLTLTLLLLFLCACGSGNQKAIVGTWEVTDDAGGTMAGASVLTGMGNFTLPPPPRTARSWTRPFRPCRPSIPLNTSSPAILSWS